MSCPKICPDIIVMLDNEAVYDICSRNLTLNIPFRSSFQELQRPARETALRTWCITRQAASKKEKTRTTSCRQLDYWSVSILI